MPLSAGLLRSQRRNATPQCLPRLQVQHLNPVSWIRVPDRALKVTVDRPDERHGWRVQCHEPLQVMTLQIPDENRLNRGNEGVFGIGLADFKCTGSDACVVNIDHPACLLFHIDLQAPDIP